MVRADPLIQLPIYRSGSFSPGATSSAHSHWGMNDTGDVGSLKCLLGGLVGCLLFF